MVVLRLELGIRPLFTDSSKRELEIRLVLAGIAGFGPIRSGSGRSKRFLIPLHTPRYNGKVLASNLYKLPLKSFTRGVDLRDEISPIQEVQGAELHEIRI